MKFIILLSKDLEAEKHQQQYKNRFTMTIKLFHFNKLIFHFRKILFISEKMFSSDICRFFW